MKKTLRLFGLQMTVTTDVAQNEERILAGIEKAARDRADFLVTPEGSLSGYYPGFDGREVAVALERVSAAAKKAGVGLALGTCYKEHEGGEECCYNQVRVYSPEGDYLGCHAKILRCSPMEQQCTDEMADYGERALRTFNWNGICFGCLICNDFWATPGYTTIPNPYLPWRLKQMGAQLILHAVNSGSDQRYRAYHESNVEIWALTLGIPILEVNAALGNGEAVNARSGLVDMDGKRAVVVPDVGESCFRCIVRLRS